MTPVHITTKNLEITSMILSVTLSDFNNGVSRQFYERVWVQASPSRFLPTFELGAAQITSGADRLGEPKNQFSEL